MGCSTVIIDLWYINILAWLRDFQGKLPYLVLFSLYPSLIWELRDKRNLRNLQFWRKSLGAMLEYGYIERGLIKKKSKLHLKGYLFFQQHLDLTSKFSFPCYQRFLIIISPCWTTPANAKGKKDVKVNLLSFEHHTTANPTFMISNKKVTSHNGVRGGMQSLNTLTV